MQRIEGCGKKKVAYLTRQIGRKWFELQQRSVTGAKECIEVEGEYAVESGIKIPIDAPKMRQALLFEGSKDVAVE